MRERALLTLCGLGRNGVPERSLVAYGSDSGAPALGCASPATFQAATIELPEICWAAVSNSATAGAASGLENR
jgi:hypothetical protein